MMLKPNINALGLVNSDKNIFSYFPFLAFVNHVTKGGGPFLPQMFSLNKLGKFHKMLFHTKYLDIRFCGFRQEDFLMFSYISLC